MDTDTEVSSANGQENLASRWARLGAAVIDGIIAMLAILPIMSMAGLWEQAMNGEPLSLQAMLWGALYGFAVFLLVHGYFLKRDGQTLGKKLLGIKITTLTGAVPDFWPMVAKRYLVVWVITYLPFVGNLIGMVDALFIFRNDKRCLHDHLAGTVVRNVNASPESPPPAQ